MAALTIVGVFGSANAARAARMALIDRGVPQDAIELSANLTADPIAGEAPGQSYENQPGETPGESAAAPYSESVRSGVCALTVAAKTSSEARRVESLLREQGARNTSGYRDREPPEGPGDGSTTGDIAEQPDRPTRDGTEQSRIAFLVERDGEESARAWVERTLNLYRDALVSSSHAALPAYRSMFEESIEVFERWLRARGASG